MNTKNSTVPTNHTFSKDNSDCPQQKPTPQQNLTPTIQVSSPDPRIDTLQNQVTQLTEFIRNNNQPSQTPQQTQNAQIFAPTRQIRISFNPPLYNQSTHKSLQSYCRHDFKLWSIGQGLSDVQSMKFLCLAFRDDAMRNQVQNLS